MLWPELVLKYRHTVIAVLLALVVLGIQARFQIPVQLFPDTDPPPGYGNHGVSGHGLH